MYGMSFFGVPDLLSSRGLAWRSTSLEDGAGAAWAMGAARAARTKRVTFMMGVSRENKNRESGVVGDLDTVLTRSWEHPCNYTRVSHPFRPPVIPFGREGSRSIKNTSIMP